MKIEIKKEASSLLELFSERLNIMSVIIGNYEGIAACIVDHNLYKTKEDIQGKLKDLTVEMKELWIEMDKIKLNLE